MHTLIYCAYYIVSSVESDNLKTKKEINANCTWEKGPGRTTLVSFNENFKWLS